MKKTILLSFIVVFATAVLAAGGTRAVPSQYDTIQEAINAAVNGDVVIVQPGRYCENINFNGKAITVRSSDPDDSSIVEDTIIDANGVGSVVTFANSESDSSILAGFTITNGHGYTDEYGTEFGGRIYEPKILVDNINNVFGGEVLN